jgi:hypothetical protein
MHGRDRYVPGAIETTIDVNYNYSIEENIVFMHIKSRTWILIQQFKYTAFPKIMEGLDTFDFVSTQKG